jgi:N-acetylglucosaminyldiphosphoundecaprenol N-acetyl-beta-D-mannosaminyltransferase
MATRKIIPGVTRITVTGFPVDVVPENQFETAINFLLKEKDRYQILLIDTWDLIRIRWDYEFKRCTNEAVLIIPTSRGISRAAGFQRKQRPHYYYPFDFVIRLLNVLESGGHTLYILGGRDKEIQKVEYNIRDTFPGIRIVGRYRGYYPKGLEQTIITAIKKASPDLLFAGRGIKRKEKWIKRHIQQFNPGLYLSSPDCFNIFSGRRRRLPKNASRFFEYAGRLLRRPWMVFRIFPYLYFYLLLCFYRFNRL